jgi:lipopolysaccharide export system permease protein
MDPMKTIDRYVLAKTLGPLLVCIAIALIAMLLERMLRLLDLLLDKGGPFYLILKMLANLIPHYLGLAIPVAFFVGMLLAVRQLSGDSELDAIYAMGVGLRRLLLPLVGLAVVLLVVTAVVIGLLQPYTRYAYRALVYTASHTVWNNALVRGTFFTGLGNGAIMVDDIGDGGRKLKGIFLHRTEDDGTTTTISAEQGQLFRLTKKQFTLDLQLIHGSWIRCDSKGEHCTVLTFDKSHVPLDMAQGPVSRITPRGEVVKELTLPELWQARNDPPAPLSRPMILAELNSRLVRTVLLLVLPLLAVPLGIVTRRDRRSVGVGVGLVLLILFHHVLRFGQSMVETGVLPPIIGLWLPGAVFAAISVWTFHMTSKRPGYNPVSATLDRMSDIAEAVRRRFGRGSVPA